MKKVLLIAGFAMCASLAFAQTAKINPRIEGKKMVREAAPVEKVRVDYKASIFTKDADTAFAYFDFSDASQATTGEMTSTMTINDVAVGDSAHANTCPGTKWHRIANFAVLSTLDTTDYPWISGSRFTRRDTVIREYMGTEHGVQGDNGFMALDAVGGSLTPSDRDAIINAFFTLPQITVPTDVVMVDIKFHQFAYAKRYAQFFVDYKVGSKWYSFEVNTSVDYQVNDEIADVCQATLPSEVISSSHKMNIRFRYFSVDNFPTLGSWYTHGYGWCIDDVEFYKAEGPRWKFSGMGYIDGFYGMIPEGFNLPLAFVVTGQNTGTVTIKDINLEISHRYFDDGTWVDNDMWSLVVPQDSLPSGAKDILSINERGFMNDTMVGFGTWSSRNYYAGNPNRWIGFTENYLADPDSMGASWTRRGLPTDYPGKNQFIIKVTGTAGDSTLSYVLDTMTYTVTGETGGTHNDSLMGRTVPGYRWGGDNGVIPSGAEFGYVLTSANGYAFDPTLGHQYQSGYEIDTRFVTPDRLPGDDWVFRGMEIIPATNLTANDIEGVRISPSAMLWFQPGSNYNFSLYGLISGNFFGTDAFTVSGVSAVDTNTFKYALPSQRYAAVNILFPDQPSIYTNANFLFGYELKSAGFFSVARNRVAYRENADSITYYKDNPALADYANQFSPANLLYSGYMYDPIIQDALPGFYFDWYPLIRMIVGPKMQLPQAGVNIQINENTAGEEPTSYWVERSGNEFKNDTVDSVAMGVTYKYEIFPGYPDEDNSRGIYSHSVITKLYVDGREVDLSPAAIAANPLIAREEFDVVNTDHDGLDAEGDPTDSEVIWPPLLKRYSYIVYFEDVQGDHSISAETEYRELSINEIAPEVKLHLAPNPATSQVRLNIAGVTGKVNCNVIDMSGRVIYNADINAENEHVINLNGVAAGAYFVRITNDNFSKVEKLVVR